MLVCAESGKAQTLAWRYAGGAGDGYSLPDPVSSDFAGNWQEARFAGGEGDGYVLPSSSPSDLSNNTTLARYGGGTQDGASMLAVPGSDLVNGAQAARFAGGTEDGHALLAPLARDFADNGLDARVTGGNNDGTDMVFSTPLDLNNRSQLARMQGGSGDGSASDVFSPGDLNGGNILARFAGGTTDGHAVYTVPPADLAGGSLLARTQGGDGDGHESRAADAADLAGNLQQAKFAGGDGDGHGTDGHAPAEGNVPAVLAAAFLQGPYTTLSMSTLLNSGNRLPLAQPYNRPPWNYIGLDSVPSIPSSTIVDWILLELRTGTAANTLAEQRAAFLRSDGSIIAADGSPVVSFTHTPAGYYYLVVRHRNHLAVMSDTAYYFGALNAPVIDFRFAQSSAFGTNPMKALSGARFGLYAGDGTGNGAITISDRNGVWRPQNGTSGYLSGDYNLSGSVTITDRNSAWRPNNGISTAVP